MAGNLLLSLLLNSGLAQYPDVPTYTAATSLRPEDRPTVPVIPTAPTDSAATNILRVRPKTNGWYDDRGKTIRVVTGTDTYKSPTGLAGLLAHEGQHAAEHAAGRSPFDEEVAYRQQAQVLKRLGDREGALAIELALRQRATQTARK